MLLDDGARLVTLTGPGGSGKTRLALHVAASLLDTFPDGAYFVDLAPISDPDLVLPTTATTLGIRPRPDQPALSTLSEWLQGKQLLLVLDNLEQVLAAAPEIGDLVGRCADLRVLATSRAPLRLRAEREFPVPPLPLPPADDPDRDQAGENDAVRLFIDRAHAARPDLDADPLVVARICRRLDGLPLAIELAAAGVRMFPAQTMLARLDAHLPLPTAGHRDAPARQRTLRDTIAWSYELLQPEAQALLRRLSIFQGGWTLDAAEAVAAGDAGAATVDVLNGLETLVEHNLIQSHEWIDGSARFSMLETIREFGLEQLAAHGERDETHRRHANFFMRLLDNAVEQLRGPRYPHWLREIDTEIENVRLAIDWALHKDPILAIRLAREAGLYLRARGALSEARRRLEQALGRAETSYLPDDLRASVLAEIGIGATSAGDFESARKYIDDAQAIYERMGDVSNLAWCAHLRGRVALWSGDPDTAELVYEDAVEQLRRCGSPTLAVALVNLAGILIDLGKYDRAASMIDEGLADAERRNDVFATMLLVGAERTLAIMRGDLPRARQALIRELALIRDIDDPQFFAQFLEGCARLAVAKGEPAHAARLLGAVRRVRDTIGVPILPSTQQEYDHYVPTARAQIGATAWDQAWSSGRALTQSEAIAFAQVVLGEGDAEPCG
jgi:non-specific serine/threonine protein kinase